MKWYKDFIIGFFSGIVVTIIVLFMIGLAK